MKVKKIIIDKVNFDKPILITKEILDKIEVGDEIYAELVYPNQYSGDVGDPYFNLQIHRMVEETDDEVKKSEKKKEKS